MADNEIIEKIKKGENVFSLSDFFGITDLPRLIKLVYAIICLILNLLIIISIIKSKTKKFSVAWQLTGNILLMNFIHSSAYLLNWVSTEKIKIDEKGNIVDENESGNIYKVGGLLIGDLHHMGMCLTQAFLLVFSALSQDFSIIIFFYIINLEKIPSKKKIQIVLLLLAYCFPFLFSLIYLILGQLGLNDRFCYVKKFGFELQENGQYKFYFNGVTYEVLIYIIYIFRTTYLVVSLWLLYKIIKFINENNKSKMYILKSSAILILQMITIILGFIYRISGNFSDTFSTFFATPFLFINTLDAIFFPLYFSLTNGVYKILFCSRGLDERNNSSQSGENGENKIIQDNDESFEDENE
jgi:hypothetical protein